ncbi:MAG: hypothetical protein AAGK47_01170 [Bacteroidota bacterium]
MASKFNSKQILVFDSESDEFFGGEMKPFVPQLHQESPRVEETHPIIPAPIAEKLSWRKRFAAMFTF